MDFASDSEPGQQAGWLTRHAFRLRLFAVSLAVIALVVALYTTLTIRSADRLLRQQIQVSLADADAMLEAALAPALARHDVAALRALLAQLRDAPRRPYLAVIDLDGNTIAAEGIDEQLPLPPPRGSIAVHGNASRIDHRISIHHEGRRVGALQTGISLAPLREARAQALADAATLAVASLLAAFVLLLPFGLWITRRLASLVVASRRIADGDLGARAEGSGDDELGALATAFNHMAQTLETRIRDINAGEERLELVLGGTADAVWDWDLRNNRVFFSQGFREMLGYESEKIFRENFFFQTALHPDDRGRVMKAQDAHLLHRTPFGEDYRLRCRDGSYRWLRGRGQALWDEQGHAYRYAGSITDLTREKLAEAAQRESEQRLYYAVRGSSDGIWDWDRVRDYYYISPRFKELLGYRDDEMPNLRSSFLDALHPDDRRLVEEAVRTHFALSVPYDIEYRMRRKDGSFRWFRGRGQAVWDEAGNVVRFSGATMDISEQKQAEAEIHGLLTEKQALLDNALVGIVMLRERTFVSCNRRFEELFGYAPGELIGSITAILYPSREEFERAGHEMYDPLIRGENYSGERQMRRRDGSLFWCHCTGRAIDSTQPHKGSIWIFADITAQRASLEALTEEKEFSDALINSLPGVFYLYDRDGRMLRWNANLERVSGFPAATILRMRYIDFVAPEHRELVVRAHKKALEHGEAAGEASLRTREGMVIPYLLTAVRVVNRGRELIAGSGMDLTDRKRAEEQIRSLNEELEARVKRRTAELLAANRELEAFSYSVSHDLAAPLRSIDGFSRMLEEDCAGQVSQHGHDFILRIRAATHRMQKLIDDMLGLSRITRNEMKREAVDLSALAAQIMVELRQSHAEREVEVSIEPAMMVSADPNLLGIALANLLRNAWKFTAKHPSARIEVGVLNEANGPVYFVRDDGAGFDMRYADQLFTPFQRMHGVKDFEGSGIGLAIVSRVIHRHGGTVRAEAEVEKGATFYFTLG